MSTPLVDWLRAQDDETLADLLRLRPDLAVPPPADLTVLATRAGIRASVHRACDDLDTVALHVLEALVVADADTAPVAPAEVARLFGPGLPGRPYGRRGARCAGPARWRGTRSTRTRPARSGRDRARPGGPRRVPASRWPRPARRRGSPRRPPCRSCSPGRRGRAARCSRRWRPGRRSDAAARADPEGPVARLLARGLLVRVDAETVELPRQVGLALRGDRPLGPLALDPPDLATVDRGRRHRRRHRGGRRAAGAAPGRAAGRVLGDRAPPALRSGGLGCAGAAAGGSRDRHRRDHGRAARRARRGGADLVAESDGVAPEWVPTTTADVWAAGGPELRSGPRWPAPGSTCRGCRARRQPGRRRAADRRAVRRPAPPDGPPGPAPGARRPRRAPAGNGRGDLGALADLLAWRAPRRGGRLRDEVVRWTLAEATLLGVVALDALSTPGRTLLTEPARAALRAARCAAGPRRPRAAAGRPHGRRAGPARARAGARAGPRGRGRVGGRGDGLPVHRGDGAPRARRRADRRELHELFAPGPRPRCRRG